MRRRCVNPSHRAYRHYGGRGITVCAAWQEFDAFHGWALATGYRRGLSLDRIDNNGPYSPSNCRWATAKQQGRNTRNVRRVAFRGRTMSITEWAEELDVDRDVLYDRINRAGWSVSRALTTPVAGRKARPCA